MQPHAVVEGVGCRLRETVLEPSYNISWSTASSFSTTEPQHGNWLIPVSTRTVCRNLSQRSSLLHLVLKDQYLTKDNNNKNCAALAKASSLEKGWTVEKCQKLEISDKILSIEPRSNRIKYCRRPVRTDTDQDSPRKKWSLVERKKKNLCFGLNPVRRCARDLQSGRQH